MGIIVMSTATEASHWVTAQKITVVQQVHGYRSEVVYASSKLSNKPLMHILYTIALDYIEAST